MSLTNMADSAKDTALFGAEKETKENVEFALDKKNYQKEQTLVGCKSLGLSVPLKYHTFGF